MGLVASWSRLEHAQVMNVHERGFLTFLAEPTRRRMETLLELGERRRRDVRELLDHSAGLDPRFSCHLAGSEALPGVVEEILRKRGAPSACHVLSANSKTGRPRAAAWPCTRGHHRHG